MTKIHLRLISFSLTIFFFSLLYMIFTGSIMKNFLSLIRMGEIISYNNNTCAIVGGIPTILIFSILSFFALFSKEGRLKKLSAAVELWMITIVVIPFLIGIIADCLLPFLLMAFSYTSCPQQELYDFYVTDIELCKTIVDNRGLW
ncbi:MULTISPECIES: DUF1240 domain-containing protein [Citrobacter]|uniref:DUF1240 domain-containing protein n=1 Tax=Citrobacter TaxID=544 RepID=UPI001299A491|nr:MULTISPECIES: DUF1240 domain-containing protein [Citrobacter]EHG7887924.1 DUF1240 domain-containing protein [Citrobacter braakii]MDU2844734.1 DUF1240 domain-containing protein [Citrobacter sp.]MDU2943172.1 DUF1240 domain-containing protein [Citrobacter sp.]QGG12809.1 DUF1240 domain-containing protein [Citrobacter braakii]WFW22465.1 DUF1240 domain-containing protein [Citrobacter braakii]